MNQTLTNEQKKKALQEKDIEKFYIETVDITNFKNHSKKLITLRELNEVFGENRTGKTAVLDAIKFCFEAKKSDDDKIKNGEEKATVEITMKGQVSGSELKIRTSIKHGVSPTCKLIFDDIEQSNPRTFLKTIISDGTFDPTNLLDKDKNKRLKSLLSLLPLRIKKEDVKMPNLKTKDGSSNFPIQQIELINFDQHGIFVLKEIEKNLINTRESLGRDHLKLKSYLEERKDDLNKRVNSFHDSYNQNPLESKEIKSYEEVLKEIGSLDEKNKNLILTIKNSHSKKLELKRDADLNLKNQEELSEKIKKMETKIFEYENCLKEWKKDKESLIKDHKKINQEVLDLDKIIEEKDEDIRNYELNKSKIESEKIKAKEYEMILNEFNKNKEKEKEVENAKTIYEIHKKITKDEFFEFKNNLIKPLLSQIPHLQMDETGNFLWNKKSIDVLSESEIIELSLLFKSLDKKGHLIFFDGAEALSDEMIQKINWKVGKQITLIRVGNKASKGFNSIEMKGDENGK